MTNFNQPTGGKIINTILSAPFNERTREYFLPSSDTGTYFLYDFVKTNNTSNSSGDPIIELAGSGDACRGVIVGFKTKSNEDNVVYRKPSQKRGVYVADSPWNLIEIQANGVISTTDIGKYANIIYTSGNITNGVSATQLDVATIGTSVQQLRILSLSKKANNTFGEYAKVICLIAEHELNHQGGGGPVGSTYFVGPITSILNFVTSEPATPSVGDRYINTTTGSSSVTSQSVTANYIYEWSGSDWDETVPLTGMSLYNESLRSVDSFTGTVWYSLITSPNTTSLVSGITGAHLATVPVNNTIYGNLSGNTISTGSSNSLFGASCGAVILTGAENSGFGNFCLTSLTIGTGNACFGSGSFKNIVTYSNNVGVGFASGELAQCSSSVCIGTYAGYQITQDNGIWVGYEAGRNSTAKYSTGIGYQALKDSTGDSSSALGLQAGVGVTSGYGDFFGYTSGSDAIAQTNISCIGLNSRIGTHGNDSFVIGNSTQHTYIDTLDLTLVNGTNINEFSTDVTLAGDSDDAAPTEHVVKTYVDSHGSGTRYIDLVNETTSFTLTAATTGDRIIFNNAFGVNCTLPQTSTETINNGARWEIENIGAGDVTVLTEGGDIISGLGSTTIKQGYIAIVTKEIEGTPNTYNYEGGTAVFTEDHGMDVQTVTNGSRTMFLPSTSGTILRWKAIMGAGTCDVTITINGAVVTGGTLNASNVLSSVLATGSNTFVSGDVINIVIANSAAGPGDLYGSLQTIRDL
jgi:hypothetical protein